MWIHFVSRFNEAEDAFQERSLKLVKRDSLTTWIEKLLLKGRKNTMETVFDIKRQKNL